MSRNTSFPALAAILLTGCGASDVLAPAAGPFRAKAPACAGLSVTAGASSYCVLPAAVSFANAAAACRAEGMELASIGSREENDALQHALGARILKDPQQRFWIGFFEPEEGRWTGSTGEPVTFGAWAPSEPNDSGGENCAEVVGSSGQWNDASCAEPKPYLCEPIAADTPMSCAGESLTAGASAYCFYETSKTWVDARDACNASGGRLAELATRAANAALARALAPKLLDDRLWIGATDQGIESAYVWTDGSPWTFSGFGVGEPNDQNHNEDCAEWIAATGDWNDLDCGAELGALCEVPGGALIAR